RRQLAAGADIPDCAVSVVFGDLLPFRPDCHLPHEAAGGNRPDQAPRGELPPPHLFFRGGGGGGGGAGAGGHRRPRTADACAAETPHQVAAARIDSGDARVVGGCRVHGDVPPREREWSAVLRQPTPVQPPAIDPPQNSV